MGLTTCIERILKEKSFALGLAGIMFLTNNTYGASPQQKQNLTPYPTPDAAFTRMAEASRKFEEELKKEHDKYYGVLSRCLQSMHLVVTNLQNPIPWPDNKRMILKDYWFIRELNFKEGKHSRKIRINTLNKTLEFKSHCVSAEYELGSDFINLEVEDAKYVFARNFDKNVYPGKDDLNKAKEIIKSDSDRLLRAFPVHGADYDTLSSRISTLYSRKSKKQDKGWSTKIRETEEGSEKKIIFETSETKLNFELLERKNTSEFDYAMITYTLKNINSASLILQRSGKRKIEGNFTLSRENLMTESETNRLAEPYLVHALQILENNSMRPPDKIVILKDGTPIQIWNHDVW